MLAGVVHVFVTGKATQRSSKIVLLFQKVVDVFKPVLPIVIKVIFVHRLVILELSIRCGIRIALSRSRRLVSLWCAPQTR